MLSKMYYKGIGLILRKHIDNLPQGFIDDLQDYFFEDNQRFDTRRFQEFVNRKGE